MQFTVVNEKQLARKIYELLQDKLQAGFRIALIGDLGAGKTALVRGILGKLGIDEPVTSPTFTLRKTYQAKSGLKIQHIDLYRHQGKTDLEIAEWLEEKDYLTFVEWPENLPAGKYDVTIKLVPSGENSRKVEVIWS